MLRRQRRGSGGGGGEERRVAEPQVAYGPPGTSGEENVSIIAAPIQSPFRQEAFAWLHTMERMALGQGQAAGSEEELGQPLRPATLFRCVTALCLRAPCLCASYWQLRTHSRFTQQWPKYT